MILDFWNTKLNPITMLPKETSYRYIESEKKLKNNDYIYLHEDLSLNELYVLSKDVQTSLGVGAKKLKSMLSREYFKDINGFAFCLKSSVDELETNIRSSMNMNQDISEYIHSNDLKNLLGINTMQLFTLSHRHKWVKKKFKGYGHSNFFLRTQVLNKC